MSIRATSGQRTEFLNNPNDRGPFGVPLSYHVGMGTTNVAMDKKEVQHLLDVMGSYDSEFGFSRQAPHMAEVWKLHDALYARLKKAQKQLRKGAGT